jgi:hypothetical protein
MSFFRRLFGLSPKADALPDFPKTAPAAPVAPAAPEPPKVPLPTQARVLSLKDSAIETLDAAQAKAADISIDLQNCTRLSALPEGLQTGTLNLSGCAALTALPRGMEVAFLDMEDCEALKSLPDDLKIKGGRLNLKNCVMLTRLPEGLGDIAQVDLSGCLNLQQIPDGLNATSWIDIGLSSITSLPDRFADTGLRWNGVAVTRQIAFKPETLDPMEILAEPNAELRRVMIERFGYDKFMEAANAVELDRDTDAGGERRLLKVEIPDDEALVCVAVQCPSTGHKFLLRVPPTMTTCHEAVAWTAGYDDPSKYKPKIET